MVERPPARAVFPHVLCSAQRQALGEWAFHPLADPPLATPSATQRFCTWDITSIMPEVSRRAFLYYYLLPLQKQEQTTC